MSENMNPTRQKGEPCQWGKRVEGSSNRYNGADANKTQKTKHEMGGKTGWLKKYNQREKRTIQTSLRRISEGVRRQTRKGRKIKKQQRFRPGQTAAKKRNWNKTRTNNLG